MAEQRAGTVEQRAARDDGGGSRRSRRARTGKEAAPGPVCPVGFCPVAMALAFGEQVRPEAVEHLLAAGRELLLAMKAVVDARVESLERTSPLERVTIE
jgi:hypothetical protein